MSNIPAIVQFKAVDKLSRALNSIRDKFPQLDKAARRASNGFGLLQQQSEKMRKSITKVGDAVKSVGKGMTAAITLPVAAAGFFAVRSFAEYETALVGVGKTTNLAGTELQQLGQDFLKLSKTIPVSATELLGLGQTAAQLGVSGSANVLKFSETLAKLSRASDVAGEEGAAALARFITVTKGSVGDVDKYASALVELGNTSAATENEILGFSLRLGAATSVFNVSGTQALGLATAMKSIGIEAEAGSSSIQRALGAMNKSIGKGGKEAQVLSKLTGIAVQDLAKEFKTNAAGVLQKFTAGLAKVEEKGGDVTKALAFFGLTGVRDIQVMGSLAKQSELMADKMDAASKAFKENIALEKEFAAASQTLDNKWQLLKNRFFAVGVQLGEKLKPTLLAVMEVVGRMLDFMESHPGLTIFAASVAAVLAVVGPLLLAFGWFLTLIPGMITGFNLLVAGFAALKIVSWGALIPMGLIALKFIIIGAVILGLILLIWRFRDAIWNGLVGAFDFALEKLGALWSGLTKVKDSILGLVGLGNKTIKVQQNVQTSGGAALSPQGSPVGALEAVTKANTEFMTQTNNARVDINVRAPQSTSVVGESENGMLSINRGLVGAF